MASPAPQHLTLRRPDDWHLHVRDGTMLRLVVPPTAAVFGRAIIMPNLVPPVTTAAMAVAYRERILAALPAGSGFQPLMTCYLTDHTDADDLAAGHADGVLTAAKLYPAHATTNSAHGVSDIRTIYPVLERMQRIGMPLLVHGEVTDPAVDIFDREAVFIERVLTPVLADLPGLKIVLEHITTEEGAAFVEEGPAQLAATVTPHHLALNRNAMLAGGIRPHLYCLPIIKREKHRLALRRAVTSGHPRFFLGTDSAPHSREAKECACGSAGIFSAPVALSVYTRIFEEEQALGRLEAFASLNGPAFYGLPPNDERVTLVRTGLDAPTDIGGVTVYEGGTRLDWRLES